MKKLSEVLSVPNLTDIHVILPSEDRNFVVSRLRVSGSISDEEILELDLPEILPDIFQGNKKNAETRNYEKRGVGVSVGGKEYRLRLTPSESLGRLMMFIRVLPTHPPPIEAVSAEYFFRTAMESELGSGLVLVSGQVGSGKSTYIAAVLQQLVTRYPIHIVSLEDPVEYLIAPKKGYATQKEVYFDSPSFKAALRDCMREDPDVLFIGEIRDYETAETALTAAESGHLVFCTIHAGSNAGIVDRLLGLLIFNINDSEFAAYRISQCIRMCLFIKRYGMLTKYVYAEITDSLRTIIRKQMLHQWMIYSSEVTQEVHWEKMKS